MSHADVLKCVKEVYIYICSLDDVISGEATIHPNGVIPGNSCPMRNHIPEVCIVAMVTINEVKVIPKSISHIAVPTDTEEMKVLY